MKKIWWILLICIALFGIMAAGTVWMQNREASKNKLSGAIPPGARSAEVPKLQTQEVVVGLDHPWDIAVLPDKTIIYTERANGISAFTNNNKRLLVKPDDLYARGEGGMMGLVVDPEFTSNRYIYACFATTKNDIKLVRWQFNDGGKTLTERKDIVVGMPLNTNTFPGRHSGCRPRFSPDGVLWIGTGDVAIGSNPQNPKSLGGKILRIDRDGKPVAGNLGGVFDPRIYSYGHRNIQGVAFRTVNRQATAFGVEHGPGKDDEVNVLKPGNYGWNPVPGYNEAVPMTDTVKYPDAVVAAWSSGSNTIAPSGGTFLTGRQWKAWQGALAVAVLKGEHLRILQFDNQNKLIGEAKALESFGRLRIAVQAADGSLYVTTDNGRNQDMIIRVQAQ